MNNDLISREALKKAIKDNGYSHYFEIFDIIDDAPPVNPYFPLSEEVFYKITDAEWEHSDNLSITTPSGKKIEFEKKRPQGEWIPIKTRPMTEEEKQNAIEKHEIDSDDLEYPFAWHFDCKLPEPKEGRKSVDFLVTTDLGFVKMTTFFINHLGCPCFEDMDEAGEFVAWMPLPKVYEGDNV